MASLLSFLFFTLSLLNLYVLSSSSSSSSIVFPLTHSLSKTQFKNTHHLLKSTSVRSTKRFRHHHHSHHHNHRHHSRHRQISLPLSPGSDYTLSLTLGSNPTETISLYMDTGSDLVWFPCSPFECILCEGKYDTRVSTKPPHPNISTIDFIPCSSPLCSKVHSSLPDSDLCAMSNCPLESIEMSECSNFACPPFYYAYADGSFIARLYRDNLSIPTMSSSPSLNLQNFTFGCANTALAEPIGVAGFGRGILSLPAQLATFSPELGNRFSYCLISHSFDVDRIRKPSPLILGRRRHYNNVTEKERVELSNNNGETVADEFIYTPMLDNPKHPYFYCVGLEAIQVGSKRIDSPASLKRVDRRGDGGVVVDSGTTFTMLPSRFHKEVSTEFGKRVGRVYERAIDTEYQTGLSPCYYYTDDKMGNIPKMVLHFDGNVSVVLPKRNYFFGFDGVDEKKKEKRKVGCLMLMDGGDWGEDSGGPGATLGNYQQQGFEVVYDLEEKKIGFARKKCSSLWDNLNRG